MATSSIDYDCITALIDFLAANAAAGIFNIRASRGCIARDAPGQQSILAAHAIKQRGAISVDVCRPIPNRRASYRAILCRCVYAVKICVKAADARDGFACLPS